MTAISAIIFLTTPSTRIMTQQILNETNAARFGNALAYCVILIVIVCSAVGLLYWIIGSSTRAERSTPGGEPMTDPSTAVGG
jgi:iron(III) transport system permease protein